MTERVDRTELSQYTAMSQNPYKSPDTTGDTSKRRRASWKSGTPPSQGWLVLLIALPIWIVLAVSLILPLIQMLREWIRSLSG